MALIHDVKNRQIGAQDRKTKFILIVFLGLMNLVSLSDSSGDLGRCLADSTIQPCIDPLPEIGSFLKPASSCQAIKVENSSRPNGLYYIQDNEGHGFVTYCDMLTAGGGWTLVASIHENNMKGRCTAGDRWSSEQGNSADHPHGDGFWGNRATHGTASSCTSDDYKNSGYFALTASDVMIWHVPNDTPMADYETSAFFKYYTSAAFLPTYGGNLKSLFSDHFLMKSNQFVPSTDNGPAFPINWERGNNSELFNLHGPNAPARLDAGYIQFRVINLEANAFALCPGFRVKTGAVNVEHYCIGSTSNNTGPYHQEEYCGDFAAMDWSRDANEVANSQMYTAVVMIFYK